MLHRIVKGNVTGYPVGMTIAPIRYKLKNWRRSEGLTQAQAAEVIGVVRRTWHQWEQGSIVPGPAHMIEIVRITGGAVQPNDFYDLASTKQDKAA